MKIYSFYREGHQLKTMEVEVSLQPGLPRFQIMGLPDSALRESQIRIKAALRNQGFDVPAHQQVLVNLKPASVRKVGYGVDLAIAVAFLFCYQQLQDSDFSEEELYVSGDLSLEGEVFTPESLLEMLDLPEGKVLLTGKVKMLNHPSYRIKNLQALLKPQLYPGRPLPLPKAPEPEGGVRFCEATAELLSVVGLGGHSLFLAGPAGSGKTTLAESLYCLMPELDERDWRDILRSAYLYSEKAHWRPIVMPHHTITPQAMVGGGHPIFAGAIVRAHGGLLILDEFLEFDPKVQEALREPLEKGVVKVFRRGQYREFPARSQTVATSNLCPCGDYVPGRITHCLRSLTKCRSYLDKINGPLLDRFTILNFTYHAKKEGFISLKEIQSRVNKARGFQKEKLNFYGVREFQSVEEIEGEFELWKKDGLFPEILNSKRRRLAFMRVSRTLADLDHSEEIQLKHMNQALNLCVTPFEEIKKLQ